MGLRTRGGGAFRKGRVVWDAKRRGMRILAASASELSGSIADDIAASDPIASVVSNISPADACTVATRLSLRYAVQCWDAPHEGKAIFWKPTLSLEGLYRSEFHGRDGAPLAAPAGILRVTFDGNGAPLHLIGARFSDDVDDTEWQLVQVARELQRVPGIAIVGIDAKVALYPSVTGFVGVWDAARLRSFLFPTSVDVGAAARGAFGITAHGAVAAGTDARPPRATSLWCSDAFSVTRACKRARSVAAGDDSALVADLDIAGAGSAAEAVTVGEFGGGKNALAP